MDPVLIEGARAHRDRAPDLRCPRPVTDRAMNGAERETRAELQAWMPWAPHRRASTTPEAYCRHMQARYLLRRRPSDVSSSRRDVMGREGRFLSGTGLHHRLVAARPRSATGVAPAAAPGATVTEAVRALALLAFDRLAAPSSRFAPTMPTAPAGSSPSAPASRSRRCCAATSRHSAKCAARASIARARGNPEAAGVLSREVSRPAKNDPPRR